MHLKLKSGDFCCAFRGMIFWGGSTQKIDFWRAHYHRAFIVLSDGGDCVMMVVKRPLSAHQIALKTKGDAPLMAFL
jgi:hypothetical protein